MTEMASPIITHSSQNTGLVAFDNSSQNRDSPIDDQVRYYRGFIEQILGVVTSSDEAAVSNIIALIRSGASHQEILAALSQYSGGDRRAVQPGDSGREIEGQRR